MIGIVFTLETRLTRSYVEWTMQPENFPIKSTKERKSGIASEVEGSGIDVPIDRSTKEVHLRSKSKGTCVLFSVGGQGIHRRIV